MMHQTTLSDALLDGLVREQTTGIGHAIGAKMGPRQTCMPGSRAWRDRMIRTAYIEAFYTGRSELLRPYLALESRGALWEAIVYCGSQQPAASLLAYMQKTYLRVPIGTFCHLMMNLYFERSPQARHAFASELPPHLGFHRVMGSMVRDRKAEAKLYLFMSARWISPTLALHMRILFWASVSVRDLERYLDSHLHHSGVEAMAMVTEELVRYAQTCGRWDVVFSISSIIERYNFHGDLDHVSKDVQRCTDMITRIQRAWRSRRTRHGLLKIK